MADDPDDARRREEDEARDRYRELLEELRTIIPGAEVLLGFLLTVSFSNRFDQVDRFGIGLVMIALLASALATILFLAPSAYHRVARHALVRERLRFGIRSMLGGLALTAAAICVSIFVVVRFNYGVGWALDASVGLFAALAIWWVVVPLGHERRGVRADDEPMPRS